MTTFGHDRWPVFYTDNHLLVLYKPAGLLTQGDETGAPNLLDLAKDWVKVRFRKPGEVFLGLVHRLDRPVAGVMVFARTSKAAARLSAQVRTRAMHKRYLAVVEGRPEATSGSLVNHILRRAKVCAVVSPGTAQSLEARLSFRVIESACGRSLVEVEIEPGRKHQIRLQMAHIGCPIAGDTRYGAPAPLVSRQIALLAREIAFEHPTRREPLSFTAPLPAGWPWPNEEPAGQAPLWCWEEYEAACGGRFKC
jgi:23S rRNA pseudouridine1911/1915/1917 synthase